MNQTNLPILLIQCKAYQSQEEIISALENLIKIHPPTHFNLHVSLPYSFIEPISKKFNEETMTIGAEVLLDADEGSFTASIISKLLEQVKAKFVLIGTTQDRTSHSPNSNHLKEKVKAALDAKIPPFVCIGDTWDEYHEKTAKEILKTQLKECLEGFSPEDLALIPIVYNADWITRTPWEATTPEIHEAYTIFKDVVTETLPDISPHHLIISIPAYSEDAAKLFTSLETPSGQFSGYSIGILGLSSHYLQPLKTITKIEIVEEIPVESIEQSEVIIPENLPSESSED